jgi:hypothetical protein
MEMMWTRLEKFFNNLEQKHTAERYFEICEQLGKEVDIDKIPPEWGDFPEVVQTSVNIYNTLGDRIVADIGFLGKDYTLLETLLKVNLVDDVDLTVEIILWMEQRSIKRSSEAMKKEHDKLKRKTNGPPAKGRP